MELEMNERFQKLAEQAEKYADDNFKGENFWTQAYESKFAELIVRDCMDVVDGYTKPRTFDTHYDAVEQIEALFGIKHFGVEE
jgi:hypothetical protein